MSTTAILRQRRDTAANWTSANPTPEAGQLCFETDTGRSKLGDGATAWNSLGYTTAASVITDNSVTDAKLRDSAGTSVIGRAGGTTGDPADIAAGTDGHVLRRASGSLGFGTIPQASSHDSADTDSSPTALHHTLGTGANQAAAGNHTHTQLHNRSHSVTSTSDHTAGNWKVFYSNGSGEVVELALGSSGQFLQSNGASSAPTFVTPGTLSDGDKGDITVSASGATWTVDNDAITYAKLQNASAGNVVLARAAGTSGDYSEVAVGASQLLGRGSTGDVAAITLGSGLSMSGTTLSSSGGVADGDKGDITVSSSGTAWTIDNDAVTYAKLQNAAAGNVVLARAASTSGDYSEVALSASNLLGRGATGDIAAITLGTNLSMSGTTLNASGGLADGDKGDITVSSSGTVWTVDNQAITYAKIQNVATDRILGRDAAGSGTVEELTVSGGLEFTGTGIQRSALTGDVTASAGSGTTTIANDAVTYAKLQNASAGNVVLARAAGTSGDYGEVALSASNLLGRGSTGDVTAITLGTGLSMSGTTLAAHARSHAITSTSDHTAGNWKVFYSNGSGEINEVTIGAGNTALISSGATSAPVFGNPIATTLVDGVNGAINVNLGIIALNTGSVTDATLRNSAGLSVIGRSANSTGVVADITAANDHEVLRRSGTALGFGAIGTGSLGGDITTAGKALLDDADAAAQRTTLGLKTAALINLSVGTTAPTSPASGDLWVDTN